MATACEGDLGVHEVVDGSGQMNEQVGRDAAGIVLVAAPAEEAFQAEGTLRGGSQKRLPIDGLGRCVGRNRVNPGARCCIAVERRADQGDLAQTAGPDPLLRLGFQLRADALASDLHDATGARCGADDGGPFARPEGEWFLAVDVLAGFDGFDHHTRMPVVGRRHDNGVDVFRGQQILVGGVRLEPSAHALEGPLDAALVRVGHGHDLGVRVLPDGGNEFVRARPGADHPDGDAVTRGRRTGYLRGSQRHSGLDKTPAADNHR